MFPWLQDVVQSSRNQGLDGSEISPRFSASSYLLVTPKQYQGVLHASSKLFLNLDFFQHLWVYTCVVELSIILSLLEHTVFGTVAFWSESIFSPLHFPFSK